MHRTLLATLAIAIGGCAGPMISTDFDPKRDFSKLRTWSWAPAAPQADGAGTPDVSSLTHERIRAAVEGELGRKGFVRAQDDKSADVWVQHFAAVGQRVYAEPGYGWYGEDLRAMDEGMIVIDVIDPKDKRLIWRGSARDAIEHDLTPEERDERIQEAVQDILEKFPPKK
jgi:hypothetical protein